MKTQMKTNGTGDGGRQKYDDAWRPQRNRLYKVAGKLKRLQRRGAKWRGVKGMNALCARMRVQMSKGVAELVPLLLTGVESRRIAVHADTRAGTGALQTAVQLILREEHPPRLVFGVSCDYNNNRLVARVLPSGKDAWLWQLDRSPAVEELMITIEEMCP